MRKIVKVCGMTQADNIKAVEELDIDWMGFIFYARSPRFVSAIPDYLPTRTKRVGVFVNASHDEITAVAKAYSLDMVQLHGSESPELCRLLHSEGYGVIKALPISGVADVALANEYSAAEACQYLLFDTRTTAHGGSGKRFDWSVLSAYTGRTPFLLSGGIGIGEAAELAEFQHPQCAGIDLNSRFETSPGIKDASLLRTFINTIAPWRE